MESKSYDSDELVTTLLNTVETLTNKLDSLEDQLKKNTEASEKTSANLEKLDTTVIATNKVFDQVATGVKDLYEKVKTLEIVTKIMGNLGNLGPLLGGLGGQPPKK